ncbi:hypothetical protein H6F93_15155 [Leptolyngbya sp. FACHB-671]|uniref:hypothetical protein n=1 Tax=Leptolyngbya sp. FACHB-671 TaxID=2692812 RepID=UPI001688C63B|nr:hypothetical protein [Leptolyngbya sp. FACHB-671]MBD2068845.1 hypothetical protein [Leptolyngbya sp. FACHB-671]
MKFILAAISLVLATALLLLALSQGWGSVLYPIKAIKQTVSISGFDADLWKAQHKKNKRDNPRIVMVPALEREVLREGMSREMVREILGLPEQIQENVDLYDLGISPYGFDYEQYAIVYDRENKLVEFSIRRG